MALRVFSRAVISKAPLRSLPRPFFAASGPALPYISSSSSSRELHSSTALFKVTKAGKGKQKATNVLHSVEGVDNVYVQGAKKEMEELEKLLVEELNRHFALSIDLRVYEDIIVTLEKGDEHKLSHLARVSLKNPQLIMINFSDNPAAIKYAKVAIQKSLATVQPQHEGVMLYVPAPRMTRERREQLAHDAKHKVFNEYKLALNEAYVKYDKKATKELKAEDEEKKTRKTLLDLKHAMEKRASDLIETRKQAMLKEII